MEALASRIDAVTVFRAGAQITRVAELTRSADGFVPRVRIGGLPLSLLDASLKARIEGDGDDLPIASDLRVGLTVPDPDDDLRPPENAELEAARRTVERLEDELEQVERELDRLRRLAIPGRPAAKGPKAPPLLTPARLALSRFRGDGLRQLSDERRDLTDELRTARRAHEHLEDLDNRASTAKQAREHELRKSVDVSLRNVESAAGAARLVLEYQIPGARWAPAYTTHLTADMTEGSIALRAVVCQQSGEDWRDVTLTLSTADSQGWNELPELTSLRIGRAQPAPIKTGWRPPPTGAEALYEFYDQAFAADGGAPTEMPASAEEMLDDLLDEPMADYSVDAGYDDFDDDEPEEAWADEEEPAPTGFGGLVEKEKQLSRGDLPPPAPPMPPPAARPAPAPVSGSMPPMQPAVMASAISADMMEAPQMRSRAAGVPGGIGGAVDSFAAGAVAKSKKKGGRRRGKADRAEPAFEPAPIDTGLTAEEQMMVYGNLQMPGALTAKRGKLVLTTRRQRYLAILEEQRIEVSFDAVAVVDEADHQARAVAYHDLPSGYRHPGAHAGFDYAFGADARVDIPSDLTFHNVALTSEGSDVDLHYVVVPRETQDAFRYVRMANPFAAPLLPGPTDVYVGGDFLLTTPIDVAAPKGRIELGLGVEQALKVSRNTHFSEETTGLMGGTSELRHEITIELVNHLKTQADVEVRERVPTLREDEDDIEIKLAEVDPPWKEFEQERQPIKGGHRWEVVLEPGEERKLTAVYVVEVPSKLELVGGNRREG